MRKSRIRMGWTLALMVGAAAAVARAQAVPEDKVYRRVVIVLDGPEDAVIDGGSATVTTTWAGDPQSHAQATWDVKSGRAEGDVRVPGRIVSGAPWEFSVPGYWVEPLPEEVEVPDAFGAVEIHVKARPAGLLKGRVLHPDGTPFPGPWSVGVNGVTWPAWAKNGHSPSLRGAPLKAGSADFQLDGLPLGGTYQLFVMAGHGRLALSKVVPVDEQHLATTIDLVLPEGTTVAGEVVDQDGKPARKVSVALNYSNFSFQLETDDAGKFAFEHVDFDLPQAWSFSLAPSDALDTQGLQIRPLTKDVLAKLTHIQLTPGVTASGKVIDDYSGKPMANHTVYLTPADDTAATYHGMFTAKTDGLGEFTVHTLEAIAYQVQVEGTERPGGIVRLLPNGKYAYQFKGPPVKATLTGGTQGVTDIHVVEVPGHG